MKAPCSLTQEDVEQQFAQEMAAQNFGDHVIPADNEWHAFAFPDSKKGKKNGAAKLSYGEHPEGVVIDRRLGNSPVFVWRAKNGATVDCDIRERRTRAAADAKKLADQKTRREAARLRTLNRFALLPEAAKDHPYLSKKGLKGPRGLKVDGPALVVPIYDAMTGDFQTVQRIWPDGKKRFPKDAIKVNGCAMPGSRALDDLKGVGTIVICEGYATAIAINTATHLPVLAAMDCGNLNAVASTMRKRFPLRKIIIAADNDAHNVHNPGVMHASKVARAVNALIAIPPPGDFADLMLVDGTEAVEKVIQAATKPPAGKTTVTRPLIQIRAGSLSENADCGEKLLRDFNVKIFQRAGTLVRPIVEEVQAAHGRQTKVAQLARIDPVYLRDLLGRYAVWQKFDTRGGKWIPTNPPSEIASTIVARQGEWQFPPIAGVITTPTMRPDGTILDQPGYDTATRLLLIEPPPMVPIPTKPNREDAIAALSLVENLLSEFPLADEVARAVALSALITPVVRGAFPVAPLHVARAPIAASGKSYLFDLVAAIAIGQPMPVMAAGRDEAETEKRLGAALLTGQPLVSIDNVNGELFGDALCQIIERPLVEVRILGKSERVRIETRGTSIFATGNNIILVGDLCRRALTVTLDARLERPELRTFKANPVAEVLANRGAYIGAALTICRAYVSAGRPNPAPRLASFEDWSDTVRSALIWLGKADPVASMELARSEDPELGALRDLLSAWADTIGIGWDYRLTLPDLITQTGEPRTTSKGDVLRWPELNAAIRAVIGARGQPDALSLGIWARGRKDRIVGDLKLVNKPNPKGAAEWWIEHKDGTSANRPGKRYEM
jgi:putative DNA primase/helicase